MKISRLLIGLIVMLTLVFNANALVDVNYKLQPTNNAQALAFNCLDTSCSQVAQFGGSFPNGQFTANGELTVRFPSTLQQNGYALYFVAQGFLPSAWHATWNSQGDSSIYTTSFPITLEKASVCRSKVDSLRVVNDVAPNVPLLIQTSTSLDANTESAFALDPSNPVKYVPQELADYYSAKTRVVTQVVDVSGNVVFSETKDVNVLADQSVPVEFTWTPVDTGRYAVLVTTEVVDDQCESTEKQSASSFVTVQEESKNNLCYSLVNDLEANSKDAEAGDSVSATYNLISNHGDLSELSTLTPVPTSVQWQVTRYDGTLFEDATGKTLVEAQEEFSANPDELNPVQHSFDFTVPSDGKYAVSVQATPNSALCTNEVQPGMQLVSFFVKTQSNDATTHKVNFELRDQNGNAVENAEVLLNSVSATSDSSGRAVFNEVKSGTFFYTVLHNNFETVQGSLVVNNQDVTIALTLSAKIVSPDLFITTFFVHDTENGVGIKGAKVTFGGVTSFSDEFGLVRFASEEGWYDYTITHSNYLSREGSVFVLNDQTYNLGMERISGFAPGPRIVKEKSMNIGINSIRMPTAFEVRAGDQLAITFSFENNGNENLKGVKATALIQELGVKASAGPVELSEGEHSREHLLLDIPENAQSGNYWVRFTVSKDSLKRVVYREITVK
ncbi:hypothetical protein HYV79_02330 [Candidatus Woesearchaeota archaeon]|nr:hypothetical protein [Candidatus Woesearchaeota archaeon]